MAYTFLQAVNTVLQKLGIVQGPDQALTSFTGDARADDINVATQAWNEIIQELASGNDMQPAVSAQGTFNLANGTREYAIPTASASELIQAGTAIEIVDSVVNQTRRFALIPYQGGYQQLILDQPDPSIFLGTPIRWVINPNTGMIRFDFQPQSGDAGNVINVFGRPRLSMVNTTDTFPFTDTVVDQITPAVAERWKKLRRPAEYDRDGEMSAQAAAVRFLKREPPRASYGLSRRKRR